MKKILFATTNEGKMREIRMIMEGSGYEITSLKDAGIKIDIFFMVFFIPYSFLLFFCVCL